MGNFDGINIGNVLANVDAIKTARLRTSLIENALVEQKAQAEDRAAARADEQTVRGLRTRAFGGDQKAVQELAGFDPGEAVQITNYFSGLSDKRKAEELAQAKETTELIGSTLAWVKGASTEQEANERYAQVLANLPDTARKGLPETFNPQWVDMTLARMTGMDKLLEQAAQGKAAAQFAQGIDAATGRTPAAPAGPIDRADSLGPNESTSIPGYGLPEQAPGAPSRVGQIGGDLAQWEQKFSLPEGYLARTAQIESGGNPNAQNPNSSAAGLFQFTAGTAAQYGVDPMDPASSTAGAAALAADNASVLRRALGREPTAAELYLAHQQGGGGAAALLSNPDAPASSVVGEKAVINNGGSPDMTAGQFAGLWIDKFNGAKADRADMQADAQGPAANIDPRLVELLKLEGAPGLSDPQREALKALREMINPAPADQPSSVQEYQFAQSQGETRPYTQWLMETKKAGATNVSVGGQELPKPSPGFVNVPQPDGTFAQAPIAGGPGTQMSAEIAGRIALAKDSLKQLPILIDAARNGDLTGPLDWLRSRGGYGQQGEFRRDNMAAAEAITRMLTGAGMNASEADREKELYIIGLTDTAQTAASKLEQLQRRLTGLVSTAEQGRSGAVTVDAGTGLGRPAPGPSAPPSEQPSVAIPPEILQQLQGQPAGTQIRGPNGEAFIWDGSTLRASQ